MEESSEVQNGTFYGSSHRIYRQLDESIDFLHSVVAVALINACSTFVKESM